MQKFIGVGTSFLLQNRFVINKHGEQRGRSSFYPLNKSIFYEERFFYDLVDGEFYHDKFFEFVWEKDFEIFSSKLNFIQTKGDI